MAAAGSDLLRRWEQALEGNSRCTPFQRPQWVLPHLESFRDPRLIDLNGGVAPVHIARRNGLRWVRLIGADYEDIVAVPGRERECVRDFFARLNAMRKEWDLCDFRTMLPDSVVLTAFDNGRCLPELARELPRCRFALIPHQSYLNVQIPADWRSYEAHIGKKLAYQMRAAEGRRNRSFSSNEIRMASAATLDADVAALIELHTRRWEAKGTGGMFKEPGSAERFLDVCRRFLEIGQLRLYTLWLDGRPASALFCLADGRRIYYYASGFDVSHQKHHPTKVLIAQAIKDAIAQGPAVFDFMKGSEEYKSDWANAGTQTWRVVIAGPSVRARLMQRVLGAGPQMNSLRRRGR
jgi:CelD/BcsL family acetyltransferase involved in cellulose biosynthesis